MLHITIQIQIAALFIVCITGCAVEENSHDLGMDSQELNATNGLPVNGLPVNGLPVNGLPVNGLPSANLTNSAIDSDLDAWLNDPANGTFHDTLMRYLVRCALPAGADSIFVDSLGNTWTWHGEIGLAPGWASGAMTDSEKRWVSSCVISLVNGLGLNVQVSQRGPASSRYEYSDHELANWVQPEGSFFGNLFAATPVFYSCSASNNYQDPGNGRICTMTDDDDQPMCNTIEPLGLCSDICDVEVQTVGSHTFTTYYNCEAPDGSNFSEVTSVVL